MIFLIEDLKLSRPERIEFTNSGFGSIQVRGGLKPNGGVVIFFSYDVITVRLHGILASLRHIRAHQPDSYLMIAKVKNKILAGIDRGQLA
jgi:hypothetical protein